LDLTVSRASSLGTVGSVRILRAFRGQCLYSVHGSE
jgi:hypothetical protein